MKNHSQNQYRSDIHRVQALSDGVFSIAMTILILGVNIPHLINGSLFRGLIAMWPQAIAYFTGFSLLGIYWLGHKGQSYFMGKVNHTYEWINLFFLSLIATIPFATQLLQHYPFNSAALIFYVIDLALIGLVLFGMWYYAIHIAKLTNDKLSPDIILIGKKRTLFAPSCYVLSLIFLKINPKITLVLFVVIPVFYIFPTLQNLWEKPFRVFWPTSPKGE